MSDALCGPSNPLQQFKQQTQLDRTLQQDRLASRASPSQGFRSANHNADILDPEFEAFQAGVPTPDLPQFNHLQRPPQFAGPSSQPSWATDFQQMHISPPTFQQHHMPQPTPASAAWTQGFLQHIAQTGPKAQQSAPSPQAFQYMARYGMNGHQNNFAQPKFASNVQSKGKQVAAEQWDDAAFDRVFNQVSDALNAEQDDMDVEKDAYTNGYSSPYQRGASTGNVSQTNLSATRVEDGNLNLDLEYQREEAELERVHMEGIQRVRQRQEGALSRLEVLQRLESDPVAEEMLREETDSAMYASDSEAEQQKQQQDDDALAKTAQELLEKVEHNNTDKFRNSQFLSLMRKLRDREMKVEGNDMVETNAAASATTDAPRFDNSEQTPQAIREAVDLAPPDYTSRSIPPHEQDHDAGRFDPRDGQAVVDLLNQPPGANPDDIGTFAAVDSTPPARDLPQSVAYGDLWSHEGLMSLHSREEYAEYNAAKSQPNPVEIAYGVDSVGLDAALASPIDWRRWDLQSPGYRSHRSAQPPPGLH